MTFDTATRKFGSVPYGEKPSAHSSICLYFGEPDHYGFGETKVWRQAKFEGDTEADVKAQVEAWVAQQVVDVVALLGGEAAFKFDG